MEGKRVRTLALALALVLGTGCGAETEVEPQLPYASEVISFTPGPGAGFGERGFPEVVLGPPEGKGTTSGSLRVLSLGDGGEIVLGFGEQVIVDGPGADFIVFENPFWADNDPGQVFAELGEVSVSNDLETWHTFPCDASNEAAGAWPGCAGWTPTLGFDPVDVTPLEPSLTGGDAFDLSTVGLDEARYVRIRDLWGKGAAPTAGFDLDAVGLIHFR